MKVKLLHLYHDIMDLYGDKGNIETLRYRSESRGIDFVYETCGIGEDRDFSDFDIIFMGGGADKEQEILSKDLLKKKEGLRKALEAKSFFLLICGAYQLFGKYYVGADGKKIEGLGFFDYVTERSESGKRCIGHIYLKALLDGKEIDVIGFENHGGQTYGGEDFALGEVIFGNGNYTSSKYEGFYRENLMGTYVHGPLLPKNPELADFILKKALQKRHESVELAELDDRMELAAKLELLRNLGKHRVI